MEIETWWPRVNVDVRRWLVNHPWDPVHRFAMEQVEAAGGPTPDSGWWEPMKGWDNGEMFLPREAYMWIIRQPETAELTEIPKRDPRADYFARGWPRR